MTSRNPSLLLRCARVAACMLFVFAPAGATLADAADADAAWQEHVTSFLAAHFEANPVAAAAYQAMRGRF